MVSRPKRFSIDLTVVTDADTTTPNVIGGAVPGSTFEDSRIEIKSKDGNDFEPPNGHRLASTEII